MTWKFLGASACAMATCMGVAAFGVSIPAAANAQAFAASATNANWAQAFDAAMANTDLPSQSLEGQAQSAARLAQAGRIVPGTAEADVSARQDAIGSGDGYRELEAGLSVSLWRSGERAGVRGLAGAQLGETQATASVARLELAGRLRSAWWALEAARAQALAVNDSLRLSGEALAIVERLEAAGEMSRLDLSLARAAHAETQALSAAVTGDVGQAQAAWLGLVGGQYASARLPQEVPSALPSDRHPNVVLALAQANAASQEGKIAALQSGGRWRVGLDTRAERGRTGEETGVSTGVRVSRPIGRDYTGQGQARTLEARATAARARAQVLGPRIEAERAEAGAKLAGARAAFTYVEARASAAREAMALVMRGRAGGELSFLEEARARATLGDAERALASARVAIGAAISNFNQSQGLEPGVTAQ